MMTGRWRYFAMMEIKAALEWARAGNVAVHATGQRYRHYRATCHLFAKDEAALCAAARELRCFHPSWIQRKLAAGHLAGFDLTHIDIFGAPLRRAMALCRSDLPAAVREALL